MTFFNWFSGLWSSNNRQCLACDQTYHKDAMKEIWFRFTEEDGTTGTSSVFVCEPCTKEITTNIESEIVDDETDFSDIEVDD